MSRDEWERLNDLLYEGWQPRAVLRELELPESKLSSLTVYARKYRNRRVLAPAARIAEILASGGESMAPDVVKLFRLVLEQALSPGAEPKQVERAARTIAAYVNAIGEAGERAAKAEQAEQVTKGVSAAGVADMLSKVGQQVFGISI